MVDNLKKIIDIAERFAGRNISLPVLGSFFIKTSGNNITITSTNLELGIRATLNGVVKSQGAAVVPARILGPYVNSLSGQDKIIIKQKKFDIEIEAGKQKTLIKGHDPDEFPPLPVVRELFSATVTGQALLNALKRVIVAASQINTKQELTSIFIDIGKVLTLAATDSFRLCEEIIEKNNFKIQGDSFPFLFPSRAAEELIRLLETDKPEKVLINVSNNSVVIVSEEQTMFSRLIEGKFPKYKDIVPLKFSTTVTTKQTDLITLIKQARFFSGKLNELKITITSEGYIYFSSTDPNVGTYESSLKCNVSGKETALSVNWRYLLDAVMSVEGEDIYIGLNGALDPVLLKSPSIDSFFHIIMPMRGV